MKTLENTFWRKDRIVLFGLSRNPKSVSREIYDLLIRNNYKIYPVNPNADAISDIKCYKTLAEVPEQPEGAILITNPSLSRNIVRECQSRGIKDFWFQYDTIDAGIRSYCDQNGLNYVYSCALLYHKDAGFPHSLHRFFYRLFKRN